MQFQNIWQVPHGFRYISLLYGPLFFLIGSLLCHHFLYPTLIPLYYHKIVVFLPHYPFDTSHCMIARQSGPTSGGQEGDCSIWASKMEGRCLGIETRKNWDLARTNEGTYSSGFSSENCWCLTDQRKNCGLTDTNVLWSNNELVNLGTQECDALGDWDILTHRKMGRARRGICRGQHPGSEQQNSWDFVDVHPIHPLKYGNLICKIRLWIIPRKAAWSSEKKDCFLMSPTATSEYVWAELRKKICQFWNTWGIVVPAALRKGKTRCSPRTRMQSRRTLLW
jgi:hypothetical protein